jgi:hypothetical protein
VASLLGQAVSGFSDRPEASGVHATSRPFLVIAAQAAIQTRGTI